MDKNLYLISLSEGPGTSFGDTAFGEQSLPQQIFSCVWELESQVNMSGFRSFFESAEPDLIGATCGALVTIGASNCAQIVRAAQNVVCPGPLPETQEAMEEMIGSLTEDQEATLNELDTAFYGYPDDLTQLLYAFVEKHPEHFGETPEL
ncbi:MAG: DUF4375 domain-containing protein [Planctomycetota bacterium]